MCIYIYFILDIVVMATTTAIYQYIPSININVTCKCTHVSMAFIVSIAYDPRNKFHYCMSQVLTISKLDFEPSI